MQETKDQIPDFIEKVLNMMENYPKIIHWGNQGQQLVIYNQDQFKKEVLPKYFRHGKLESFVRQLNMYSFHKVCRNKSCINFRNKFFFKGNQSNFHLIKRRKKDDQDEGQPKDKMEQTFVQLLRQKHQIQFPELPILVQQILEFKARSNRTMNNLRKQLDILGRQLNERKGKIVKPAIAQIKQMISSIDDSSKKTEISIEQLVQDMDNKDKCSVKKEQNQHSDEKVQNINIQIPQQHLHHSLPHHMSAISYPALHNPSSIFGPFFHNGTIINVPSLCSYNSVTNFIS